MSHDTGNMNADSFKTAGSEETIAAPLTTTAASVANPVKPVWIRLPRPSTFCPWTGLSRSKLNELILPCPANENVPPVRSVCLRQKGAVKGVRLIHLQSLLDYLSALDGTDKAATQSHRKQNPHCHCEVCETENKRFADEIMEIAEAETEHLRAAEARIQSVLKNGACKGASQDPTGSDATAARERSQS